MNLLTSSLDILHGTRSEKSHQTWIGSVKSRWNIYYQMNFDSGNLAATWRMWKQTRQLYLDAAMSGKTEEQQYSTFLFVIGE